MTDRGDQERPYEQPENPIEELIEGFEKTGWRPARSLWGAAQRRLRETEERREELIKAWRRRRADPASGEAGKEPS